MAVSWLGLLAVLSPVLEFLCEAANPSYEQAVSCLHTHDQEWALMVAVTIWGAAAGTCVEAQLHTQSYPDKTYT